MRTDCGSDDEVLGRDGDVGAGLMWVYVEKIIGQHILVVVVASVSM